MERVTYAIFRPYGTRHVIVIENVIVTLVSRELGDTSENPMYVPVSVEAIQAMPWLDMDVLANWDIPNGE